MQVSKLISHYIKAGGSWAIAGESAREAGLLRKSAVGGSGMGDFASTVGSVFLESLAGGPSAFDRLRPFTRPGALLMPVHTSSTTLQGTTVNEAQPIPMSGKFLNTGEALTPLKAAALACASNTALEFPEGVEMIVAELRRAVATATDSAFLAVLDNAIGSSAVAATSDALTDIQGLLADVHATGHETLYFITSPSVVNLLATMRSGTGGPLLFPGVLSGTLMGLPLLATSGASDSLYLVDAGSLVTGAEEMQIKLSTSATLELDDTPTGEPSMPTGASKAIVSMFQSDATGILGVRSFGVKVGRTSGAAVLTDITASTGW